MQALNENIQRNKNVTHKDKVQKKGVALSKKNNLKQSDDAPYAKVIADNEHLSGVLSGFAALKASGMQMAFAIANMEQAIASKNLIILRVGKPPRSDIDGAPKPTTIKSKTTRFDLIEGVIPKDQRFNRPDEHGKHLRHHPKDVHCLSLDIKNWHYQHTKQLPVRLDHLIKSQDIFVLGFNEQTGDLRLAYRAGKGPESFKGQFVINLYQGIDMPRIFSREWDNLEYHPEWDAEKQLIRKPKKLAKIPDEVYEKVFNKTFLLNYTNKKTATIKPEALKPFEVFASQPFTAEEFKRVMGEDHPQYKRIASYTNLMLILRVLDAKTIKAVYDKAAKIVVGDWDGLVLGHAPDLEKKYTEIINTFDLNAPENTQQKLLSRSEEYLQKLKLDCIKKEKAQQPLSPFEQQIMAVPSIEKIISTLALARAGCISAHGFVFKQLTNYYYRDPNASHFGEEYNAKALQDVLNFMLHEHYQGRLHNTNLVDQAKKYIKARITPEERPSEAVLEHLAMHIVTHLRAAIALKAKNYVLPNTWHDRNISEPYQHGWEMDRTDTHPETNKCNLEGDWFVFTPDGCMLYGKTEKELVDVLMSGNGAMLKVSQIAVNPAVNMKIWAPVIKKQLEFGQKILKETLNAYSSYKKEQKRADKQDKENTVVNKERAVSSSSFFGRSRVAVKNHSQLSTSSLLTIMP